MDFDLKNPPKPSGPSREEMIEIFGFDRYMQLQAPIMFSHGFSVEFIAWSNHLQPKKVVKILTDNGIPISKIKNQYVWNERGAESLKAKRFHNYKAKSKKVENKPKELTEGQKPKELTKRQKPKELTEGQKRRAKRTELILSTYAEEKSIAKVSRRLRIPYNTVKYAIRKYA